MIAMIRNKLQGTGFRIAMAILLLLIAIVWLMPPASQMSQRLADDWIMDINGNKVPYSEFRRRYLVVDQQLQMIKQQYGPYADYFLQSKGISNDPQEIVLKELTSEELLNQVARAVPLDVSSEYIQEKLKDRLFIQNSGLSRLLPPDLIGPNGAVDSIVLRNYLKRINLSAKQFEESLEHVLERFVVSELIGLSAHVPSFQLENALKNQYASKKFSLLSWSLDNMIDQEKKAGLTDDALQEFYTTQTAQYKKYWVPEKRSGELWVFEPESYGINVTDQEIEKYYDRNKSLFIEKPVQIQVRRIVLKVENESLEEERYALAKQIDQELKLDPTQFARLAKEHSDDIATASSGGLIDPFSKGAYEKQFEQVAFLLKNDGDISNIFKSKDGFEIVQRVSKIPTQYKPLNTVKQEIRQKILLDAFKRRFASDVARLSKKPTTEQLQAFAKEHNAVKKESVNLVSDGESAIARALFTLRRDEVTSVVDQGHGYLVQLDEIQKKHLPKLDQIRDEVARDLYASRAYTAMQEQMALAKKQSAEETFEQLKQRYGISLKNTGFIDFSDEKASEKLKSLGVPTGYFSALEKVGGVFEYGDDTNGYLIRLDEVEPLDESVYLGKEEAMKANVYREEIGRYVEGFVDSLLGSATIKYNPLITDKLKDRAS